MAETRSLRGQETKDRGILGPEMALGELFCVFRGRRQYTCWQTAVAIWYLGDYSTFQDGGQRCIIHAVAPPLMHLFLRSLQM